MCERERSSADVNPDALLIYQKFVLILVTRQSRSRCVSPVILNDVPVCVQLYFVFIKIVILCTSQTTLLTQQTHGVFFF